MHIYVIDIIITHSINNDIDYYFGQGVYLPEPKLFTLFF